MPEYPNQQKLRNKVAIVTGAGRGIGKAIALEFAREGANLAIVSRTKSELDITAAQTKELGAEVMAKTVDVADQRDVSSFVQEAADIYGRIDVLVNNAGVLGPAGPLVDSETQKWVNTLMVNLVGTYLCSKFVLPVMIRQKAGKVINLSGAGSPLPYPMFSAYAASKVGVLGLTQTLAEEVKKHNIQVNVIAPGPVDTRLQDEILAAGERAGERALERARETKRTGGVPPGKAAALAVFLASADSDGLTGRFLSAVWDNWRGLGDEDTLAKLMGGELFTLRRIDGVLFGPIDKERRT